MYKGNSAAKIMSCENEIENKDYCNEIRMLQQQEHKKKLNKK